MDKSKSLEKFLSMVLKKKYSEIEYVKVTYTLKKLGRVGEREILDHRYGIYVYFMLESTINRQFITNDIKDLTKMILTEPNEHYYSIFYPIEY